MQALRSFTGVLVGFGFMVTAGMVATSSLAVNLVLSGVAAVLGGWLAARIAGYAEFRHALALASIVLALTIGRLTSPPAADQPGWYALVVGLVGTVGVLIGGGLRSAAAEALHDGTGSGPGRS